MQVETRADTPEGLVAELVQLLDVEQIDTDLYVGHRQPGGRGRVFGGQVIGQALVAAQRSVDPDKSAHSLHAYFMRAGDERRPIVYQVRRDFDGRSFSTRRVIASQEGKPILNLAASFQLPEEGLAHQEAMPDVPPPEALRSEQDLRADAIEVIPEKFRDIFLRPRPVEIRPATPRDWVNPSPAEPQYRSWFRTVAPLPDDPAVQRAVLAYISDMSLLGTAMLPHGITWVSGKLQSASLDHALWIHEPFRVDDWLLYATDSPWSGHARGFNRGSIYARDGRLVASVAQEGLIRLRG